MELNLIGAAPSFPVCLNNPVWRLMRCTPRCAGAFRGSRIRVTLPEVRFANADAQGTARVAWRTYDGAVAEKRFPGVLDLEGHFQRARLRQVVRDCRALWGASRWITSAMRRARRRHSRCTRAHRGGRHMCRLTRDMAARRHFPFWAPLTNAEYHFRPATCNTPTKKPWPALTQLNVCWCSTNRRCRCSMPRYASMAPDIVVRDLPGAHSGSGEKTLRWAYRPICRGRWRRAGAHQPVAAGRHHRR